MKRCFAFCCWILLNVFPTYLLRKKLWGPPAHLVASELGEIRPCLIWRKTFSTLLLWFVMGRIRRVENSSSLYEEMSHFLTSLFLSSHLSSPLCCHFHFLYFFCKEPKKRKLVYNLLRTCFLWLNSFFFEFFFSIKPNTALRMTFCFNGLPTFALIPSVQTS